MSALGAQSNQLQMTGGDVAITVRLVDGQYPNYQQVIPGEVRSHVTANTAALIGSLRRAELVAGDRASMVKLSIANQTLIVTANSDISGNAYEELEVEQTGEDLAIAFNARYLVEILNHVKSERVVMEFLGPFHRSDPPTRAARRRRTALRADAAAAITAHLRHLALSNFRNYTALDLEPATGLNVFVGANAQGKSNLLESIAMLGTGKSFRTAHDADTVRGGLDLAVVRGDAKLGSGTVELVCAIERTARGTRKTYTLNGAAVRYARYLGNIRVVTFVPADLQLAAGTPAGRRAFLNVALRNRSRATITHSRATGGPYPEERAAAWNRCPRSATLTDLRTDAG